MEAEEKEVGEGEAADQDKGTPQEGGRRVPAEARPGKAEVQEQGAEGRIPEMA